MGARNEDMIAMDSPEMLKVQDQWKHEGKQWDVNPPKASHAGGVWERCIGKIRRGIEGCLEPKTTRLLNREEFITMLQHVARIVNSTPLWEGSNDDGEPQPISPQMLLTQRDDGCRNQTSTPQLYNDSDLIAYGKNRWKRIECLADTFWEQWQTYMYDIGSRREKWTEKRRNAQVGDLVLMRDKQTQRLDWPTAEIIEVYPDAENIVRSVMVKPITQKDKAITATPRKRAVHDLVLIKEAFDDDQITQKTNDTPNQDEQVTALFTRHLVRPSQKEFIEDDSWYLPTGDIDQHEMSILRMFADQLDSQPPHDPITQ